MRIIDRVAPASGECQRRRPDHDERVARLANRIRHEHPTDEPVTVALTVLAAAPATTTGANEQLLLFG